ncbi:putative DNA-dependent ATPase RAD57 NDAI_0A06550 [Naumovozyma dairenensis CBS 421]|uniref:RecA family profile 1 domain-containing protein n=1 Tax=Naumovozyma dairenensis (strain ATCC 10597 / BCRC 20456 / CBS 421 / NBRC 0211 / NRRL Y-12639) TaxID=1071378 RepID=G0W4S1_NAUDC|nr:hypothetical protein NDAI_0A06550 [Naumovozyma dairenensis CBS 421]CCD22809.1 hypothetical protein NDAI_0A06550 [Naumovozyma dairenensis CBS 421]
MDLYDELPHSELLSDPEFTQLLQSTRHNQLTVVDFITLNTRELARVSQRSITEINKFRNLILKEFEDQYNELTQPKPIRILDSTDSTETYRQGNGQDGCSPVCFTTGDVTIDESLGGGIFLGNITEIFGESSTGKSQLLMQLCLSVQLPKSMGGLESKCVYITTEGDLPTTRLEGILDARPELKKHGVSQHNIFTVSCNDLITQEHILNVQLPVLLEQNESKIKLIIIDSISHHMRVELQTNSIKASRNNRYYVEQMAERLLHIADKHSLAIVVANQVSDKPMAEKQTRYHQTIMDYEYQLGWVVGWKDSTILYRQKSVELPNDNNINRNHESILSDDEDSILIETELNKVATTNNSKAVQPSRQLVLNDNLDVDTLNSRYTNVDRKQNSTSYLIKKKPYKKKIDTRVPNLGLSWANHVSTRILLRKTYMASPMIKRGDLKYYDGTDTSKFWQARRTLKVVFSSFCKPGEVAFIISKKGIESVGD